MMYTVRHAGEYLDMPPSINDQVRNPLVGRWLVSATVCVYRQPPPLPPTGRICTAMVYKLRCALSDTLVSVRACRLAIISPHDQVINPPSWFWVRTCGNRRYAAFEDNGPDRCYHGLPLRVYSSGPGSPRLTLRPALYVSTWESWFSTSRRLALPAAVCRL